jgi:hypothetical protein
MAKVEPRIDTSEAMKKLEILNVEAEKFKSALRAVTIATGETTAAMNGFAKACGDLKIDQYFHE